MINEIDILHERHCCDFACLACEKTAGLFRIVSYHHKIVIELGEYRFDSFTEPYLYRLGINTEYILGAIMLQTMKKEILAIKLRICSAIVLSSLLTTNLLIICNLCNFFIYKYLEF